jgi:hypothetical protein
MGEDLADADGQGVEAERRDTEEALGNNHTLSQYSVQLDEVPTEVAKTVVSFLSRTHQRTLGMLDTATDEMIRDLLGWSGECA